MSQELSTSHPGPSPHCEGSFGAEQAEGPAHMEHVGHQKWDWKWRSWMLEGLGASPGL